MLDLAPAEVEKAFSMNTHECIHSYEPSGVAELYDRFLRHDFQMLQKAGMRNVVAYGDALRDADNGALPRNFCYYAQMPKADSNLSALSTATTNLLAATGPGVLLDLKGVQGDHAVRFAFKLRGRRMDLTLINNNHIPGAELAARAAPIGLCGITFNDRGFGFASSAYFNDQSLKCLTINHDLSAPDRYNAEGKARALVKRPAYRNFQIVR